MLVVVLVLLLMLMLLMLMMLMVLDGALGHPRLSVSVLIGRCGA